MSFNSYLQLKWHICSTLLGLNV